MNEFKNILIVRTDRIGDVVLTIPSINAVRAQYPHARITLMIAAQTYELVCGLPTIDEIIIDDRKGKHRGLGYFALIRDLRKRKFDLAVVYHTKRRTNLACFLAGIPKRIGYKNNKFGFLLSHPIDDTRHEGRKHEAEYCMDVLRELSIAPVDLELDLPVQEECVQWVEGYCLGRGISNDQKIFAIHPGASDPSKCWSEKHFAQLIDQLIDKYGPQVAIIGGPEVKEAAKRIISMTSHDVHDMTGLTTVGQLTAFISRCTLLVSNDSGPVHIASAVGTPVVSIFTRNQPGINPERWRPLGKMSEVVSVSVGTHPEISFKKAKNMDPKYTELIAVSEVLQAVDSLYKLC